MPMRYSTLGMTLDAHLHSQIGATHICLRKLNSYTELEHNRFFPVMSLEDHLSPFEDAGGSLG